jgi:hypothetical protein
MQKWPLIFILISVLSSCSIVKSRKTTIESTDKYTANLISDIFKYNITNSDFFIQKAEVIISEKGEIQELLASLKYNPPDTYLLSIKNSTGIEAARIMITSDTILVNDRLKRRLFYGSTKSLKSKFGISFRMIPLIVGDISDNQLNIDLPMNCINGKGRTEIEIEKRKLIYIIDCIKSKIERVIVSDQEGNGRLNFKMSKITEKESKRYPKEIEIEDSNKENKLLIRIDRINFGNVEEIKFIPGNNYEKILLK